MGKRRGSYTVVQPTSQPEDISCSHVDKSVTLTKVRNILPHAVLGRCCECVIKQNVHVCLKCGKQLCHTHSDFHKSKVNNHSISYSLDEKKTFCSICKIVLNPEKHNIIAKVIAVIYDLVQKQISKNAITTIKSPKSVQKMEKDVITEEDSNKTEKVLTIEPFVKGLRNTGVTCYFNSVLQNLIQTPLLRVGLNYVIEGYTETLLSKDYGTLTIKVNSKPAAMLNKYDMFLQNLDSSDSSRIINPYQIFGEMCAQFEHFGSGQQDSQEAFHAMLSCLISEEHKRRKNAVLESFDCKDRSCFKKCSRETKKKIIQFVNSSRSITFVDSIFKGVIVGQITCLTCKSVTKTRDNFLDLSVPLPKQNKQMFKKKNVLNKEENISKHQRKKLAKENKKKIKQGKNVKPPNNNSESEQVANNYDTKIQNNDDAPLEVDEVLLECETPDMPDIPAQDVVDITEVEVVIPVIEVPQTKPDTANNNLLNNNISLLHNDVYPGNDTTNTSNDNIHPDNDTMNTGNDNIHPDNDMVNTGNDTMKTGNDNIHPDNDMVNTGNDTMNTGNNTMNTGNDTMNTGNDASNDTTYNGFSENDTNNDTADHGYPVLPRVIALGYDVACIDNVSPAVPSVICNNDPPDNSLGEKIVKEEENEKNEKEKEGLCNDLENGDEDDQLCGLFDSSDDMVDDLEEQFNNLDVNDVLDVDCEKDSLEACLYQFCKEELMEGDNQFGCLDCAKHKHRSLNYSQTEITEPDNDSDTWSDSSSLSDADDKAIKPVKRDAIMRLYLHILPPVLVFHLKRFSQDGNGRLTKDRRDIKFGAEINLDHFMYEQSNVGNNYRLYGLVEHSGSLHRGHYISYVRKRNKDIDMYFEKSDEIKSFHDMCGMLGAVNSNMMAGKWYCCDDSRIYDVPLSRVLNSDAYLLFYERVEVL